MSTVRINDWEVQLPPQSNTVSCKAFVGEGSSWSLQDVASNVIHVPFDASGSIVVTPGKAYRVVQLVVKPLDPQQCTEPVSKRRRKEVAHEDSGSGTRHSRKRAASPKAQPAPPAPAPVPPPPPPAPAPAPVSTATQAKTATAKEVPATKESKKDKKQKDVAPASPPKTHVAAPTILPPPLQADKTDSGKKAPNSKSTVKATPPNKWTEPSTMDRIVRPKAKGPAKKSDTSSSDDEDDRPLIMQRRKPPSDTSSSASR